MTRAICVHGFTQTAASWQTVITHLHTHPSAPFREVVALDAPSHGSQQDRPFGLVEGASDLGERGGTGVYIGYSMGARLALHLALAAPTTVSGLVMIGGTPGIEDAAEREARRVADEALAHHIEQVGVAQFLTEWLAQPLFATLPADHAGATDRLRNSATALAHSLRMAGTGTQAPLWGRLDHLQMPVLVITGAVDTKFTALGERMVAAIDGAEMVVIADAGHAVHLEQPAAVADAIAAWWVAHKFRR